MTKEQIETLVKMMTARMERESAFLNPDPEVFMRKPYEVLDWMVAEGIATAEELDRWMVKQQTGGSR